MIAHNESTTDNKDRPAIENASSGVPLAVTGFVDSIAARLLDLLVDMAGLEHLLQGICELAVEAVPGCESASITVIEGNNARTPAASDQRARRLDEAQYRDGDGPGLRAARLDADILIQLDALELAADIQATEDGTGVRSGPTWREQARDAGISAVVSMPIAGPADLRAALNLYTGRAGGWNPEAMALADALVTYAGDAVTIGRRLDPGHLFQP